MLYCTVHNNVITGVATVDSSHSSSFESLNPEYLPLPEGKWIGDPYHDEAPAADYQAVWDEMAAAYKEGVQEA